MARLGGRCATGQTWGDGNWEEGGGVELVVGRAYPIAPDAAGFNGLDYCRVGTARHVGVPLCPMISSG